MRPHKFTLHINPEEETEIRAGMKTIDARIQSGDTSGLSVGDLIHYNSAVVRVLGIRRYPSFEDLIHFEDFKKVVPSARSGGEALEKMQSKNRIDEKDLGVEAIEFVILEG